MVTQVTRRKKGICLSCHEKAENVWVTLEYVLCAEVQTVRGGHLKLEGGNRKLHC